MGFTTALQNKLLDDYFAVERFMSLHLGDPGAAGSYANEVSATGTGYVRQSLSGKLSAATGGLVVNTGTVTFPTITALYGAVSNFATGSALSGGQMGIIGVFNESSLRGIGQTHQYPPGALRFQLR